MITIKTSNFHTRVIYSSANLYNNNVYFYGGETFLSPNLPFKTVTSTPFKINTNTLKVELLSTACATKKDKPPPVSQHCSVIFKNQLFIYGGTTFDLEYSNLLFSLNLETHLWERRNIKGSKKLKNISAHASILIRNRMVVFGGYTEHEMEQLPLNEIIVIHLEKYKFRALNLPGSPKPRYFCSMVALKDQAFLIFGGKTHDKFGQSKYFNDLYRCNFKTWEKIMPNSILMPIERSGHCSHLLKHDQIVVFGGQSKDRSFLNDLWIFDLKLNTWNEISINMGINGRYAFGSVFENETLMIFGGENDTFLDEILKIEFHVGFVVNCVKYCDVEILFFK
eukprot:gene5519-9336_t